MLGVRGKRGKTWGVWYNSNMSEFTPTVDQQESLKLFEYGFYRIDDLAREAGSEAANNSKTRFKSDLLELQEIAKQSGLQVFIQEKNPDLCLSTAVPGGGFNIKVHEERGFAQVSGWLLTRTPQPFLIETVKAGVYGKTQIPYIVAIPNMSKQEFYNTFKTESTVGIIFSGLAMPIQPYGGFMEENGIDPLVEIFVITHARNTDDEFTKLTLPSLDDPKLTPFGWG